MAAATIEELLHRAVAPVIELQRDALELVPDVGPQGGQSRAALLNSRNQLTQERLDVLERLGGGFVGCRRVLHLRARLERDVAAVRQIEAHRSVRVARLDALSRTHEFLDDLEITPLALESKATARFAVLVGDDREELRLEADSSSLDRRIESKARASDVLAGFVEREG